MAAMDHCWSSDLSADILPGLVSLLRSESPGVTMVRLAGDSELLACGTLAVLRHSGLVFCVARLQAPGCSDCFET